MTWDEIVRLHGPHVYKTAWRILGHAHDCEDVVQEVFIEAHRLFVKRKVRHWATFLNSLATYRAIDCLRRRRNFASLETELIFDSTASAEQNLVGTELEKRIREIVASLPDRQAAVFCLVHFDEQTNSQVAQLLEISDNAVAIALHKARSTLRQRICNMDEDQKDA